MFLTTASDKLHADRTGSQYQVNETTAPTADGAAGHANVSDLGQLEHLFRDPFIAALHTASTVLPKPTNSTPGPWGGLRPGYLQHAATTLKADGEQLLEGSLAHANDVGSKAPDLRQTVESAVWRVRTALSKLVG